MGWFERTDPTNCLPDTLDGCDPTRWTGRKYVCPACRERRGVDILYGHPFIDDLDDVARSELVFGGCMQEIGAPDRKCLNCGHSWEIVRRGSRQKS